MRALSPTMRSSEVSRGLLPFHRTVAVVRTVEASYSEVERAVRVCLSQLVETASPSSAARHGYELVADLSMRRWFRRIRVPVDVEVEGVHHPRPGLIAHLRWRARRGGKGFPVMEADLLARPVVGAATKLVLAGTYHPPLGTLGVLGDLLVGRLVARSTAESFLDDLSHAIETAIAEGRCTAPVGHLGGVA
jgi:hypothetical protein